MRQLNPACSESKVNLTWTESRPKATDVLKARFKFCYRKGNVDFLIIFGSIILLQFPYHTDQSRLTGFLLPDLLLISIYSACYLSLDSQYINGRIFLGLS